MILNHSLRKKDNILRNVTYILKSYVQGKYPSINCISRYTTNNVQVILLPPITTLYKINSLPIVVSSITNLSYLSDKIPLTISCTLDKYVNIDDSVTA